MGREPRGGPPRVPDRLRDHRRGHLLDVNFLELAETWQRQGVEPGASSAFPAGRLLDERRCYGFAVAQSTWYDSNRVIDCTGATVARSSDILPHMTAVLNLNRRVLHMDGNLDKIPAVKARYGADVLIEDMRDEALMVITSMRAGLEVADIVREFSLETLADYLTRSRAVRAGSGGLPDPWGGEPDSAAWQASSAPGGAPRESSSVSCRRSVTGWQRWRAVR